jgi:hypothetical protein
MRRRSSRLALATVLPVTTVAVLATAIMTVTPASAATVGQTWTAQSPPDLTAATGTIQAMSCVSTTRCTAVGYYNNSDAVPAPLAQVWNGHSWRLQDAAIPPASSSFTPNFTGVSCLSARFCLAVGSTDTEALNGATGFAETWNGTAWTLVPIAQPSGSIGSRLYAVSCVTTGFCEAVGVYRTSEDTYSLAERWNGSSWQVQSSPNQSGQSTETWLDGVSCVSVKFCQATDSMGPLIAQWNGTAWTATTAPGDPELSSVSCTATIFCQATGTSEAGLIGERWNGTSWQVVTIAKSASGLRLSSVSCPLSSFCEATGYEQDGNPNGSYAGFAATWNGTTWQTQAVPPTGAGDTATNLAAVSCVSARYCEAGGSFPVQMDVWNGTAWSAQQPLIPQTPVDNDLAGVSCLSATSCEAVGGIFANPSGLPETWNGTTWQVQANTSLYGAFSSISCLSATFCEATGQEFAQWNGTSWTTQPTFPAPAYQSVSCGSTTFCVAVGDRGAATWNGTTWAATALPTANGPYGAVSCVSATFCMTVAPSYSTTPGATAALWDGTSWTTQTVPGPPGSTKLSLRTISCVSATFCELAGLSGDTAFTDTWNGTAWTEQATLPAPSGSDEAVPWSLTCLSATNCTLAGSSFTSAGTQYALIEGWDGTSWTVETSSTQPGSWLSGVSCVAAGSCVAVGSVQQGPVTANLAEVSS